MARPTLIYSSKSSSSSSSVKPYNGYSRGSSRASTPPSTPYYQSLDVDPIATLRALAREDSPSSHADQHHHHAQQNSSTSHPRHATARKSSPQSQAAWTFKRPSKDSILHYLSLILSVRLLFHTQKLSLLLLTMVLAITLEGRARMEKLGLRGTMTATLAVVCGGLGLGNLSVGQGWSGVANDNWTSAQSCRSNGEYGAAEPTLIFTGNISSTVDTDEHHGQLSNDGAWLLTVSVCTGEPIEQRRESESDGPSRFLSTASKHFIGSSQHHVSTAELCRSAIEDLDLEGRSGGDATASGKRKFHIRIAVEPADETETRIFASNSVTECVL